MDSKKLVEGSDKHIYLYAKGHYKRTNKIKDLKNYILKYSQLMKTISI